MADPSRPNLSPNILHKYDTFNTIFTLSGITEKELLTSSFLEKAPHDIIARTGGIGDPNVTTRQFAEAGEGDAEVATREAKINKYNQQYSDSINILARGHDLFVENVNMISTVGPNNERSLGNFTKMEFEVHEPFGITFIEKVRAATGINGYLDYQDAPLLLTIEFVGNFAGGQAGGEPVVNSRSTGKRLGKVIKKIPILIARVDMDVNEGGARYSVVAVPYTDLAYDDRYKYPRTVLSSTADNILDWIRSTTTQLTAQQRQEKEDKVRTYFDFYEFSVHPDVIKRGGKYEPVSETTTLTANVADTQADLEKFINQNLDEQSEQTLPRSKGSEAQGNPNIAITKYFEDAIRSQLGYQALANDFWVSYLRGTKQYDESQLKDSESVAKIFSGNEIKDTLLKNQYVDWFKIRTSIETPDPQKIDPITKMSPKRIIYQAVPFKIHILKFVPPGVSLGKIDWSRNVVKDYNYLYTGDNLDVQNLRINYKTAYYMRNTRSEDKNSTEKGLFTVLGETFKRAFGLERDPEPLLPLRQYPSAIKGPNTMSTNRPEDNKAQMFYDYLTHPEVDMMKIELEILGDPDYLCQDMYVPIGRDRTKILGEDQPFSEKLGFLADRYQPIISVRYRLPDDIDEKQGTMFSEGLDGKALFRDENLFFNGLYQVNKIESKFDSGQFLQTLYCSRFNNQQGQGVDPLLLTSAGKSITNIKNAENLLSKKSTEQIMKDAKQAINKEYYERIGKQWSKGGSTDYLE
mgnify:CR=1 FL=1